jgi:hypothetical protein
MCFKWLRSWPVIQSPSFLSASILQRVSEGALSHHRTDTCQFLSPTRCIMSR